MMGALTQGSHAGCTAGSSPFALQQQQCSPIMSASSAGTAVGSLSSSGSQSSSPLAAASQQHQQQQQGYASLMGGAADAAAATAASAPKRTFSVSRYMQDKEWLYRLITFPSYFTPCPGCCGGARTPKREQLMTQFDTEYPYRVYCSHCPECKDRLASGCLLQVRRSAFKDVVKANDITRFGADVAGVQQYTLNGSKVIYLNREQTPEKKGANTNAAPAACSVDGRAMMDKSSCYCSLKCKLIAEDPGFTSWLDTQDPSVRILAQAAANAPPRPTPASKRPAAPTSSASSGGSGACSPTAGDSSCGVTSRPPKVARTLGATAATTTTTTSSGGGGLATSSMGAAGAGGSGSGSGAPSLQRSASAAAAQQPSAGAGLKRIRISLAGNNRRQQSAPSGSALTEPHTGAAAAAAMAASSSWMDLDHALSSSAGWDSWDFGDPGLDSPTCFAAAATGTQPLKQQQAQQQRQGSLVSEGTEVSEEESGSMSPALIHAPTVFRSGSSSDDWWLCGSPGLEGAFTCVGMGALLN